MIICDRCSKTLTPGEGNFYVIKIEAVADPSPPIITEEDLRRDIRDEIDRLFAQLRDLTEQEDLDQVHRRVVLYLCGPCYRRWIENPVGD
jgi:hypothetical protein